MIPDNPPANPPPILEVEDRLSAVASVPSPLSDPLPPAPAPAIIRESEVDDELPKHVHRLGPDGPPRTIDDHTQFWSTYDRVADSYDKELLDAWNKSLDVLLIFAGLFSAINTAFIIESYRGLQSDPAEITNALLRLSIIHRNDNVTLSLEDLVPPAPSAVPINSIFFSSLSFSLTAAFGAVTAKQWLTEYANVGIMKALHVQGKRRQEKFNGLKTWHFRLIIELLPVLLQISLLLFLVGVVHFLWTIDRTVAIGQLVLSAAGLAIYIVTIVVGIIVPTSPFQTPLSRRLPRFFNRIRRGFSASMQLHRFHRWTHLIMQWFTPMTSFINKIGATDVVTCLRAFFGSYLSLLIQWIESTYSRYRSAPKEVWISGMQWNRSEIVTAEAIVWLLEQAEHPDVTIAALDALPRLPSDLMLSLVQRHEGLLERLVRFHNSLIPPRPSLQEGNEWIKTWPNRVMVSGVALSHILKSQRFQCRNVIQDSFLQSLEEGDIPDFPSDLRNEDPIVFMHYLVDLNLCSLSSLEYKQYSFLHYLKFRSAPLGPSPLIQVELVDVRQALTGSPIIASILQPELVLDFVLRVAWTGPQYSGAYSHVQDGNRILEPLSILLQGELSRSVVSHIAITFAVVCWSSRRDNPWSYPSEADQRRIEHVLMQRCLAVDKSKYLLENIVLALSMIDVPRSSLFGISDHSGFPDTLHNLASNILHSLIKIAIPFLEAPAGPFDEATILYPNFAQGLLRLSRKVNLSIETIRHEITMLLAFCPVGDWLLHTDDECGDGIVRLLASLLSNDSSNVTEMLFNRMARFSSDVQFRAIIESPKYIYPHRRSVTSGIYYHPVEFITKTLLLHDHHLSCPSVLLETQISFSVPMLYQAYMIDPICNFLNRMVQEDSVLHWPAYFIDAGIVPPNRYSSAELPIHLKFIDPYHIRHQVFDSWKNGGMSGVWWGEALLMLWKIGKKECLKGGLPPDWNDSLFFTTFSVMIMTRYYKHIRTHKYTGIDWDLVKEYFGRAFAAMQVEGYVFELHYGGYVGSKEEFLRDIEQVVQELSNYSNNHPTLHYDTNFS